MKVTWLGQAGLLFQTGDLTIVVDPYLSESCLKLSSQNYRRMPLDPAFLEIEPEVLVLTHDHMDHADPETLAQCLAPGRKPATVLASANACCTAMRFGGKRHNYVCFNRHTVWTQGSVSFTAVKAEHSDPAAIGVIIDDGIRKYYVTGDTLFNTAIFPDLPSDLYAMFVVVNGVGNNMNMADAQKFARTVRPRVVVPVHWGMHDDLDPSDFDYPRLVIPEIYREIPLP